MTGLAEKIREKLTIDETAVIDQLLERLSKFIGLTKDGKVVIKISREKVTIKNLIALYLLGKYMAKQAGYSQDDVVGIDELARELGIDAKVVAARCAELRREAILMGVERGLYRINPSSIEYVLAESEGHT